MHLLNLPIIATAVVVALMATATVRGGDELSVRPPTQMASTGLSSQAATHPRPMMINGFERRLIGEGAQAFWVFFPSSSTSKTAPVVFFMHGWLAMDPYFYGGWIDHLVKSGSIVVYPVFQTSRDDTPESMRRHALEALQQAVKFLNTGTPAVRPDWGRLSIVGHSFGGGLATLMAAEARAAGLPTARLVLALAPGWRGGALPSQTLRQIPASSYLLVVESANDELAASRQTSAIFRATPQLSATHKEILMLETSLKTTVTHNAPLAPLESYRNPLLSSGEVQRQRLVTFMVNKLTRQEPGRIDFIDRNGYWQILDRVNQALDRGESPLSALTASFPGMSGTGSLQSPRRLVVAP